MVVEILFFSPIWRAKERRSAINAFNIDQCILGAPRPGRGARPRAATLAGGQPAGAAGAGGATARGERKFAAIEIAAGHDADAGCRRHDRHPNRSTQLSDQALK
jgi:hypothetical protein